MDNTLAKHFAKAITEYSDEQSNMLEMDLAMDGSGELGHKIYEHHDNLLANFIRNLSKKYNFNLSDLEKTLDSFMELEIENRPVVQPTSYNYFKYGFPYSGCPTQTKYHYVSCILSQLTYNN